MSQTNYSNIENNITKVNSILIEKIATFLRISPSDLKTEIGLPAPKTSFNSSNRYEVGQLIEMIKMLKDEILILQETLKISNTYNKSLLENKVAIEDQLKILLKQHKKN